MMSDLVHTPSTKSEKNLRIAQTYAATLERRSRQTIVQIDLKVKYGKRWRMPQAQMDFFSMVFVEAKRFKNYLLSLSEQMGEYEDFEEYITEEHAKFLAENEQTMTFAYETEEVEELPESLDLFKTDQKDFKTVKYYTKGTNDPDTEYIDYKLQYLSSYAKANVINTLCSNIKTLKSLKVQGKKVGKIRYVSDYKSITYKKQGYGFDINIGNSTVRLQGCKKWFKVFGMNQMSDVKRMDPNYEIATANLVKVGKGDYHVYLTIYVDKQKLVNYRKSKIEKKKYVKPGEEVVGLDFGCETSFTLSNGEKFNCLVEESERLKQLQRRLSRCVYHSNNWFRLNEKLRKAYTKMTNLKDELARKFVHYLKLHHEKIVMQNENLKAWQKSGHGKKVWHSIMGRVKELLKNEREIDVIILDRLIPTTKFCPHCGQMHKLIKVWDREYVCPYCNERMDRDVHAA